MGYSKDTDEIFCDCCGRVFTDRERFKCFLMYDIVQSGSRVYGNRSSKDLTHWKLDICLDCFSELSIVCRVHNNVVEDFGGFDERCEEM